MDVLRLVKLISIIGFLILTNPQVLPRIEQIGIQLGLAVYLLVWLITVVSIFFIAYSRNGSFKLLMTLFLVPASCLSAGYFAVTHQYMEIYEFEAMWNAANNLNDALGAFSEIGWVFLAVSMGVIGIWLPFKSGAIPAQYGLSTTVVAIGIISAILLQREGEGTKGMPVQMTPLAYTFLLAADRLLHPKPSELPALTTLPYGAAFQGDIIVIMDESVRGDFLDIGHPKGVQSGLAELSNLAENFGRAASATNCSDTSNVSFRRIVHPTSYLDDIYQNPTIWQFAQAANYRTVYLDAQLTQGRLGNHMTSEEVSVIDTFIQIHEEGEPLFEKDNVLARRIHQHLINDQQEFILVNKMGVHFPYEGKYPKDHAVYLPVMEDHGFDRAYPEDHELQHPTDPSRAQRIRFVNSYKNALAWNVSRFFKSLDLSSVSQPFLMFYTADHGQTFHDDGREGYGTHCSIAITDPEEGIVPLVVLSNDEVVRQRYQQAAELNFDHASHFNIAPSILVEMGYKLDAIRPDYKTLFDSLEPHNQQFLSKYFVRFGAEPIWNGVDMKGRNSIDAWQSGITSQSVMSQRAM